MVTDLRDPAVTLPSSAGETTHAPASLVTGWLEHDDRYQVRRRRGTPTWLLFLTVSGRGFLRAETGAATTATRGDLHLYRPGAWQNYGTVPGEHWHFHYAHFHPRPQWDDLLRLAPVAEVTGLVSTAVPGDDALAGLVEAFAVLHRDSRLTGPWRGELALNALERVLLLAREAAPGASQVLDPRVKAALDAIATDPAAAHTVSGLARAVHLSPSRFAHLFRAQVGRPVIQVVLETRLREAAKLLEHTTLPVGSVAAAVGFGSPFHFSTSFRSRYGDSPRAYRERRQPRQ